jgi:hypothetical protein
MAQRRFYGKNREQRISGEICRESCFQITSEPILKYIRICYIDDGFLSVCSKIIGQMIAEEVLIYGVNIVLGPEVTIKRNPLWQKF